MPSSYTSSLRLTLIATGELINVWGDTENAGVITLLDFANAGWTIKALTSDYTLTTANGTTDEARAATLKFTGAGPFTVTIPSVGKSYDVWNACSAALTITTGAGTASVIQPGEIVRVICDGSNVRRVSPFDFGAQRVTSVADPINPQDAATRAYVDATAFVMAAGALPGQAGNNGFALLTNGVNAVWTQLTSANLSDTAARDTAALGRSVAFAVAL